jgi:hypothetical protein
MPSRSDAATALATRFSRGFTVAVGGVPLPLRALSQTDGFGRLGLFLVYSPHAGAEALRPWMQDCMCDEDCDKYRDDPLILARMPGTFIWAVLTEPLHDPADRAEASVTTVAVNPRQCKDEVAAMVRAGVIRPLGRRSRQHAPLYEILGMEAWEKYAPSPRDEEPQGSAATTAAASAPPPPPPPGGAAGGAAAAQDGAAAGRCCACGAAPPRLLRCTGACGGAAQYCGRACQVSHWAEHRRAAPCRAVKKQPREGTGTART